MTETEEPSADISSYRHFRVGDWLVESDEGRLSRGDESVRVEPKAMEVLVYLAERRGEVVTREELERHVWRGALVGYDAVTSTVAIIITWTANIYEIIVFASKAFVVYYALQCSLAAFVAIRPGDGRRPFMAAVFIGGAVVSVLVLAFGIPAEGG